MPGCDSGQPPCEPYGHVGLSEYSTGARLATQVGGMFETLLSACCITCCLEVQSFLALEVGVEDQRVVQSEK